MHLKEHLSGGILISMGLEVDVHWDRADGMKMTK